MYTLDFSDITSQLRGIAISVITKFTEIASMLTQCVSTNVRGLTSVGNFTCLNSNRWLPKRARLKKLSHDSNLVILHSTTKHNRNCCFHNVHYVTPFQDLEVSDLLSLSPNEFVHLPYCYYWSWELQSTILRCTRMGIMFISNFVKI